MAQVLPSLSLFKMTDINIKGFSEREVQEVVGETWTNKHAPHGFKFKSKIRTFNGTMYAHIDKKIVKKLNLKKEDLILMLSVAKYKPVLMRLTQAAYDFNKQVKITFAGENPKIITGRVTDFNPVTIDIMQDNGEGSTTPYSLIKTIELVDAEHN